MSTEMSVWVDWLHDEGVYLQEDDDWKGFRENVNFLNTPVHDGSMVLRRNVDGSAHLVRSDETSSSSPEFYVSSAITQAYSSSTEGSDTPQSTPAQTCTGSSSPPAIAEDTRLESVSYFFEGIDHQDPHVVGHLPLTHPLNHAQTTSSSGSPSAILQHGLVSGQMRLPFATHDASSVTPISGARQYGTGGSSSYHDQLGFGQPQLPFQEMAPVGRVDELMITPHPAAPYQYSTLYPSHWPGFYPTLPDQSHFANRAFQHGLANIETHVESRMDVDQMDIKDEPSPYSPAFLDVPSPRSRLEVSGMGSSSSLPVADHGHRVSPHSAPFQATAYSPEDAMDFSYDHVTRQAAQPTIRSGTLTGVEKREPMRNVADSNTTVVQTAKGRRTGELTPAQKEAARIMREIGVCWPCKMLKETCDYIEGAACCSRCANRGDKLTAKLFFKCVRIKTPRLIEAFLPPSVSYMHQIHSVQQEIRQNVDKGFDGFLDQDINVSLSIGFGPPLKWKLREFKPKEQQQTFLVQSQYVQNSKDGQSVLIKNWSPPLGVKEFDGIAITKFERYLDDLSDADVLKQLGGEFYKAESKMDRNPEKFQATLLQLMCDLKINSNDAQLRKILNKILRMLLVTYIMAHVLTIKQSTIEGVVRSMRHIDLPTNIQGIKHISPRLANQQFKCHFSRIRAKLYSELLEACQKILLRNANSITESTWTQSFCLMLGFAMVLEEIQHTLYIQAHASIVRGNASCTEAEQQCSELCQNIDKNFELLIGLHQARYRKKFPGSGSLGSGTPDLQDDVSRTFAHKVRRLAKSRLLDLERRADVKPTPENHPLYTTRLTAKFLRTFRDSLYS